MGATTGISWCDATWNPWMGCDRVSPGCDNCYMFREQARYGHDPTKLRRSKTKFNDPLKWQARIESDDAGHPMPRKPFRVFTCSWSDFFHADADQWRDEAWEIISETPDITYQILTKRPSRIARHLPADWGYGYPNVWLGVSAETQEWADRRIPVLLDVPAVVRFVSAEPLLGPITLAEFVSDRPEPTTTIARLSLATGLLHWVIVGGESDHTEPRTMDYEWARALLRDCRANNTAFFFKQRSGHKPSQLDGVPGDLLVHEFPA